jgi:hypothetical protein
MRPSVQNYLVAQMRWPLTALMQNTTRIAQKIDRPGMCAATYRRCKNPYFIVRF